ncbi:hypothetical protein [Nostoc sp.]
MLTSIYKRTRVASCREESRRCLRRATPTHSGNFGIAPVYPVQVAMPTAVNYAGKAIFPLRILWGRSQNAH